MITDPVCPVCHAQDWEVIARRKFRSAAIQDAPVSVQHRLRVLFELWQPGQAEVSLEYVL